MNLLVFDVDATLVYQGGNISKPNREAIQSCLDEGDVMAIASGRESHGIAQYLNQFRGSRYAIGANGAAVYDEAGHLLFSSGLPLSAFYEFREAHLSLLKEGGAIYAYSLDGKVLTEEENPWTDLETRLNHIPVVTLKQHSFLPSDPILKIMVAGPKTLMKDFAPTKEEKSKYHLVRSNPCFVEVLHKGVDKASGVEWLRKALNIPAAEVYTFGDEGNDVEMLRSYQGIAMGNAIPEAKAVAKFVTLDVQHDGVAYAIRHWVKERKDTCTKKN